MRSSLTCLALAATASALPAQPLRNLPKADAEYAEPFTTLNGIRELSDGRVIAIDTRDKTIQLVDLKAGTAKKIGREGSGPREYGLPMALVPLPDGASAVYDPLNSRLLKISPAGDPGEFLRLPAPSSSGSPGGAMMVSMTPPKAVDAKGRFYVTGSAFRMGPNGPEQGDSVAILRVDIASGKSDTVGFLEQPKSNIQTSGTSGNMQVRMGMANPFLARDDWFVTPDGRVGILRSPEYRLDWISPERRPGPALAYDKMKVSEGHKQQWRDARRGGTAIMVTNNNGTTSARTGSPGAGGIQVPEPTDWPEYMPPFVTGQNAINVAPDGNLWVSRTRDAKDQIPKYDVIDASGKVAYRVALPAKTRVIGFGTGVVYTARTDEDDLQYLQRHKMP